MPHLLESIGYHDDTNEIVVAPAPIPLTRVLGSGPSRFGAP